MPCVHTTPNRARCRASSSLKSVTPWPEAQTGRVAHEKFHAGRTGAAGRSALPPLPSRGSTAPAARANVTATCMAATVKVRQAGMLPLRGFG